MKRSRKSIEQRSKTSNAAETEGQCPTVPTHTKPWLDSAGAPLADAALKTVSKGWSAQTWERYLQTLEVGLKESQPSLEEIGRRGICRNIFSLLSKGASDVDAARLNELLKVLTEKQIFVIKKIFWEGLSERQVARMLSISRQGVFDLKKRAIRKLQIRAPKVLASFPIVEIETQSEEQMDSNNQAEKRKEVSSW